MKNREIKFRAWDNELNIYIPSEYIGISGTGEVFNNSSENCSSDPKNWMLEQFTGLTDKYGKDIYEGDIVNVGSEKVKIEYLQSDFLFGFYYNKAQEWYSISFLKGYKSFEIIGNINKNPELI